MLDEDEFFATKLLLFLGGIIFSALWMFILPYETRYEIIKGIWWMN
jgi:hypothetical protein